MGASTKMDRHVSMFRFLKSLAYMISKQPKHLLAKSYLKSTNPPNHALLVNHTRDVVDCGEALLNAVGRLAIENAGLPDSFVMSLGESARLSFWLQDLGKANSHFFEMVSGEPMRVQLLRHETISGLIATNEPIRSWLASRYGPELLQPALWAAVGHHRKFGGEHLIPRTASKVTVWLGHPDFGTMLREMAERLSLDIDALGHLPKEWTIGPPQIACDISAGRAIGDLKQTFQRFAENFCDSSLDRWLGILKAIGIAADVSASAYARRSDIIAGRSIADHILQDLAQGLSPADLDQLAWHYAWEQVEDEAGPDTPSGFPPGFQLHPFQREVARLDPTTSIDPGLTLAVAGCGSGKSLAAYLWAKRWCEASVEAGRTNFRLIFTLPTTGTATEHFKDYALACGVSPKLKSLSHSRSSVDLKFMASDPIAQEEVRTGTSPAEQAEGMLKAQSDRIEALNLWGTPLVVGTADTVLGLMANARRSVISFPAIMQAAVVFDEIHAYDDELFGHLLMFLQTFPKIPVLLMTASLPVIKLRAIQSLRPELRIVKGPPEHEDRKRYARPELMSKAEVWLHIRRCLCDGSLGKVLWIRNQVDWANQTYRSCHEELADIQPYIGVYHSRFRHRDRTQVHAEVIRRFKRRGQPCVLVVTQVAEMSLNLSADLLICDLAPIPSLIQRLGRLNRFAKTDFGPSGQVIVCEPPSRDSGDPDPLPYTEVELSMAREWLKQLRNENRRLSQRDLADAILGRDVGHDVHLHDAWERAVFISGRWQTIPASTRGEANTIPIILESDYADYPRARTSDTAYRTEWLREHEVSIPIRAEIRKWEKFEYTPIAPADSIHYGQIDHPRPTERTGAKWADRR